MKKKNLVSLVCLAVAVMLFAGIGVAYAAGWIFVSKSDDNTVTIGQPLTLSVERTNLENDTLLPGEVATFTFSASASDASAEKNYVVKVTVVNFTPGGGLDADVWSYAVGDSADYTNRFAVGAELATLTSTSESTITLKVKLDLDDEADGGYAGKTLSFTVEVVEATPEVVEP